MLNANLNDAAEQSLPLTSDLPDKISANWPVDEWRDSHVLLAVSGGADSVALLRAACTIKTGIVGSGALHVGHLNHGLRHAESDADEVWLAKTCLDLGVPFESAKIDVAARAAEVGGGIEAAARQARYQFLRQAAERIGARYVVTAHTANDQVETVLHRIVRGTGLAGLAGIPRSRRLSESVTLIRPMLTIWRSEVTEYLCGLGQSYRSDMSNEDLRYTRNRLRNELLPLIRERLNANVDDALLQLGIQAGEAHQYFEEVAAELVNQCVRMELATDSAGRRARRIEIDCTRLAGVRPVIIREVLKAAWSAANWPQQSMGYAEWCLLASMAAASCQQSVANLPSNVLVRRVGNTLELASPSMA
jgi:tRNA(Ile)-lysidine synthase